MPSGNESKDRGDNLLKRDYTRAFLFFKSMKNNLGT